MAEADIELHCCVIESIFSLLILAAGEHFAPTYKHDLFLTNQVGSLYEFCQENNNEYIKFVFAPVVPVDGKPHLLLWFFCPRVSIQTDTTCRPVLTWRSH